MGGTPGPGPFGAAAFGGGGFPTQQFGGPPSSYALPSGIGGASPYPPMGAPYGPNGGMHATPFDSRAAEAAFTLAWSGQPLSHSLGGYILCGLVLRPRPVHRQHPRKRARGLVLVSATLEFVRTPES